MADNFISLRIKLTTDFTQLSTVRAIKSDIKAELDALIPDKETDKEGLKR